MPIVPIYQGGVPQVGANATATTPIQAPRPAIDYERTFQQAMQPISAGVDAVGKIIATEHARNVKAESDEAEAKFMACVQNRLLSPETGYMGLQGKNAVDGFQPTQDALRKDMSDILGGLSPEVRSAVESRIQDRFLSARGQMLRWNQAQTQQWHLNSSKARMESLIDDAAQHYGDEDYLAKTWLSVAEEANYQARIQGFDEEGRKQTVQGLYDLFESQRFSQWAADDAVGAFAAAQRVKPHMSADVWGKLDSGLWGAAKQEIALRLSQMVPPLRSKKDIASVVLDRNKRTGWAVVDELSPARKAEVYSTAWGYMERIRSEGRASLKRAIDNSLELAGNEGSDPNPLSEDAFVEAYGEEDGKLAYKDYESNLSLRENVFRFNGLTNEGIVQTLDGMRPKRGSENYAVESENYRKAQKAAAVVVEARQKDPMGAAIQDAKYGLAPITNWGSQDLENQFKRRKSEADQVAVDYGTQPVLLTDSEADSLVAYIDKLPPAEQGAALSRIADALGDDGMISVLGAQLGPKKSRLGTACYLMSDDKSVGLKYLKGMQYVDEKRVQFPSTGEGSRGEVMRLLGEEDGVAGLTDNSQTLATLADAVQGLWAYGQESTEDGPGSLDEAVEQAVGTVEAWNGRKIVMPKRADGKSYAASTWPGFDFSDLIDAAGKRIAKEKGEVIAEGRPWTMRYFAYNLPNMQLQSIDDGRYWVIDSTNSYVKTTDGRRFVLDVNEEVGRDQNVRRNLLDINVEADR